MHLFMYIHISINIFLAFIGPLWRNFNKHSKVYEDLVQQNAFGNVSYEMYKMAAFAEASIS